MRKEPEERTEEKKEEKKEEKVEWREEEQERKDGGSGRGHMDYTWTTTQQHSTDSEYSTVSGSGRAGGESDGIGSYNLGICHVPRTLPSQEVPGSQVLGEDWSPVSEELIGQEWQEVELEGGCPIPKEDENDAIAWYSTDRKLKLCHFSLLHEGRISEA